MWGRSGAAHFTVAVMLLAASERCNCQSTKSTVMERAAYTELARLFGSGLRDKTRNFSGCLALKSMYKYRYAAKEFAVRKRDWTRTVTHFASELQKMLGKKHSAVKRLVDEGERIAASYNWTREPQQVYNNVLYLNAPPEDDDYADLRRTMSFEKNSRFNMKVNVNTSVVQVPFNVYCKDTDLLKSVEWSKSLNAQFRENFERDPTLRWQYFGAVEGYVRIYPGFQWKLVSHTGQLNLYDCRTQLWYTQAATYPKDMLILLDASGSMTGLRKSIAVQAVATLLGTLSDNDFFNVLTFKKETEVVEPCFNGTLVRADKKNIEAVVQRLEDVKMHDIASFEGAFRTALDYMVNFHDNGSGSGCNCAIMLITDGAPENYQWVFDEANLNRTLPIRVFTYLVGQEKHYLKPVREMACNNQGFFTQVESPNSVTEQVLRHVNVINRPLAITGDHHTAWTKGYYDKSNVDEGLGLITTVAMPVYRNTTYDLPSMLGVMAIDVPVSDMIDTMPVNTVGVNAYIYIITNNGYVLYHPRLKDKYLDLGRIATIPNADSFDINNLEYGEGHDEIRSRMLSLQTSQYEVSEIITPLDDWSRVIITGGTYHLTPIQKTPFRLALVLPSGYGQMKVNYNSEMRREAKDAVFDERHCALIQKQLMDSDSVRIDRLAAICSLAINDVQLADSWRYCRFRNEETAAAVGNMSQLQMLRSSLLGEDNGTIKCNEELVNGVLFDVFLTSALVPVWAERREHTMPVEAGVEMSFMISKSGLMRQYWYDVHASDEYKRSRSSALFSFTRTEFPSIYRRTVNYESETWMYTLPNDGGTSERFGRKVVVATTAIKVNGGVLGVSGVLLKESKFREQFWESAGQTEISSCAENVESGFDCYVIDENGIVMLSRQQDDVGKFFGALNGHVTRKLIASGVFRKVSLYDYGAMCFRPGGDARNSGKVVGLTPLASVWAYIIWWVEQLARLMMNLTMYSWWAVMWSVEPRVTAGADVSESSYSPCHKKYEVYVINHTKVIDMPTGRTLCDTYMHVACEREYGVINVSHSNLYLVVVQKVNNLNLNCSCPNMSDPILPVRGEEINYPKEQRCQNLRENKERRRPDGCIAHHEAESRMNLSCYVKSNSASRIFPLWWKTKRKGGADPTVYRAWLSCLTIHLTFVALCAAVLDGSLLRVPYDW